jgi:ribose transport system ATP-binding protein
MAGEVHKKDFSEEFLLTLAMKNIVSREKVKEAV